MAETRIDTIIGKDAQLRGNVQLTGTVRVDGLLAGDSVHAEQLIVGVDGRIQANVCCQAMEIAGTACGDLLVSERLTILSSGRVYGDIRCGQFIVEDGGVFEGRSHVRDRFRVDEEETGSWRN